MKYNFDIPKLCFRFMWQRQLEFNRSLYYTYIMQFSGVFKTFFWEGEDLLKYQNNLDGQILLNYNKSTNIIEIMYLWEYR